MHADGLDEKRSVPVWHQGEIRFVYKGYAGGFTPVYAQPVYTEPLIPKETPMSRTSVTIDGVILTRSQVEKALTELNKPEELAPQKYGTFLKLKSSPDVLFVVPSGPVVNALDSEFWATKPMHGYQSLICVRNGSKTGFYNAGGAYRVSLSNLEVVPA
jgi:hypothetical protein